MLGMTGCGSSWDCDDIPGFVKDSEPRVRCGLGLASEKELYKFQTDSYWDPIYLLNKWDEALRVTAFGIDLSIDGKIMMECSDHLWDYVTTLMRKSLKQHKLAGALHMTITG